MQSRARSIRLLAFIPMLLLGTIVCTASVAADGALRSEAVAIVNVRVFDGKNLTDIRTVVIENGLISPAAAGTAAIGRGGTLLPGLIDSHIHLESRRDLEQAARWVVTTMLDMATHSMALVDSLRHLPGLPDLRSSGSAAAPAGGNHVVAIGDPALTSPGEAEAFVAARAAAGVDHIKVVIEPGRWADLLLVDGDPTADIAATRNIRGVWIAGMRVY